MRPKARGFTLVELTIAIVLLLGGIAAATFVFGRGIFAFSDTEALEQGLALAQEKMEATRGAAFASIASEAKASVSGWPGFSREVTVTEPQTDLKQVEITVYWDTNTGEQSTSLVTYVVNAN